MDGGSLYLPRLYVYHSQTQSGTVQSETFKVMERRLLKAIMTPAMIASFIFGIWMLVENPDLLGEVWFHVKATAVLIMAAVHGKFSKMQRLLEMTNRLWQQNLTEFGTKSRHF